MKIATILYNREERYVSLNEETQELLEDYNNGEEYEITEEFYNSIEKQFQDLEDFDWSLEYRDKFIGNIFVL